MHLEIGRVNESERVFKMQDTKRIQPKAETQLIFDPQSTVSYPCLDMLSVLSNLFGDKVSWSVWPWKGFSG
jgi:hypothetical protein